MSSRRTHRLLLTLSCVLVATHARQSLAQDAAPDSQRAPTSEQPLPAAQAAEHQALTDPAPAAPPTAPGVGPSVEATTAEPTRKRSRNPMGEYSVGVMLGIAKVASGDIRNPTYISTLSSLTPAQRQELVSRGLIGTEGCGIDDRRCSTEARRGLHLSIPIQLGGTVVGFRFEPYFTFASNANAYGLYTGPTFDFHVWSPLYLGFGLGLKAAWVKADGWKYAGDLYGRIPMHAIWYVHDHVGLVAEFGFGGGASLFVGERGADIMVGSRTYKNTTKLTAGFARTWDLSFGVRFP